MFIKKMFRRQELSIIYLGCYAMIEADCNEDYSEMVKVTGVIAYDIVHDVGRNIRWCW